MVTPPPAGLEPNNGCELDSGLEPDTKQEPGSAKADASHRVALTRWSVVGRASESVSSPAREIAREQICRGYWYPMYVYLRRKGHVAEVAEEYVQGFFLELFDKNVLASAEPGRGKFRTFLLTALVRYVGHCQRESMAMKRGGHVRIETLESGEAENRYAAFASRELTPEAAFDRAWALAVLDNVLRSLEAEHQDRPGFFAAIRPYLTTEAEAKPYAETARELGMSELNVKVTVHRLRVRYRKLLDEHLRATVEGTDSLEEERRVLMNALVGNGVSH